MTHANGRKSAPFRVKADHLRKLVAIHRQRKRTEHRITVTDLVDEALEAYFCRVKTSREP